MFKIVGLLCVALVVAFAISTAAEAQRHRGGGFHGGHFGGGHISRHYGGVRIGRHYGGARYYGRGYHGRYYGRGYRRYGRYGYRYGGYWPFWGWGLAAGAWASAWPYYYDNGYYYDEPAYDSAVAYCMRRYRSYDPVSRTYLGYDGYRHPCP